METESPRAEDQAQPQTLSSYSPQLGGLQEPLEVCGEIRVTPEEGPTP
jgi:hypothetical protein